MAASDNIVAGRARAPIRCVKAEAKTQKRRGGSWRETFFAARFATGLNDKEEQIKGNRPRNDTKNPLS